MRKLLFVLLIANLILVIISLVILPADVAMHFGRNGIPNSWASKYTNALIFVVIHLPLFAIFYFAPSMTLGIPEKYINLPNKKYWLKDENKLEFKKKFGSFMAEYGVALFLFLFCIQLLTMMANLSDPVILNEGMFLSVFIGYMAYTVYWCIKLFLSFKIPKDGKIINK